MSRYRGKLTAAALAAALAVVTGCSSGSHVSVAACKQAIRKQLTAAVTSGNTNPPKPAACQGIPPKTLEKLLAEVFTGH